MNIECGLCGHVIPVNDDGQPAVAAMVSHVATQHPGDALLVEPQIVRLRGAR